MDKQISVGDLVVVVKVKPCCGRGKPGSIFRVIKVQPGAARCLDCGEVYLNSLDVQAEDKDWVQMNRVKRIPPLGELEGEKRDEKLTEPA